MKLENFMAVLDDGLAISELREFALVELRKTGIHDWEVKFFIEGGLAPESMTLGEWRPIGAMTANPKGEGGIKVPKLA